MNTVHEITCKSILSKSNIESFDYAINPYVGCLHDCSYCYAQYMKKFSGHSEDWGKFLDIKINAYTVLEEELEKINQDSKIILSSVTDCYQMAEKKYKITRKILDILSRYSFKITILTKSKLVLRDIDLLKKLNCEVGLSINTSNDEYRKLIEPNAGAIEERVECLDYLKQNGIKTFAFIASIIPYITEFESIFETISGKVDYIMGECININDQNWEKLFSSLKSVTPCDQHKLKIMIKSKTLWEKAEAKFSELCKKYCIECKGFYKHV